jgi:hypothetical protein
MTDEENDFSDVHEAHEREYKANRETHPAIALLRKISLDCAENSALREAVEYLLERARDDDLGPSS